MTSPLEISEHRQKRTRRRSDKYQTLFHAVPQFLKNLGSGAKHKDLCEHFNLARNDATFITVLKHLVEAGLIKREENKAEDARVVLYSVAYTKPERVIPAIKVVETVDSQSRLSQLEQKLAEKDETLAVLQSRLDELEANFAMFKKFAMEIPAAPVAPAVPVASERPLPANLQARLKDHIEKHKTTEKVILGDRIRTSFLGKS